MEKIETKVTRPTLLTLAKYIGLDEVYPECWNLPFKPIHRLLIVEELNKRGYTHYENDDGFIRPVRK